MPKTKSKKDAIQSEKERKKPEKSLQQIMREAKEMGFGNHYGAYVAYIEGRGPGPKDYRSQGV